jgi:hypothetical protein
VIIAEARSYCKTVYGSVIIMICAPICGDDTGAFVELVPKKAEEENK